MNKSMTIELEGKTYVLDISKAINVGILTKKKEYPSRVGQRIKTRSGGEYIIASVDSCKGVNLISLDSGLRINNDAFTVENIYAIKEYEIDHLCHTFDTWTEWSLVTETNKK